MADAGLYERLGVDPDADLAALRAAYRRLARELHPDLHHGGGIETQLRMAMVNEAWAVLSDPDRRAAYDAERRRAAAMAAATDRHRSPAPVIRPQPNGGGARLIVTRKDAWINGLAVRIRFLVGYAGRSAVQAMLLRHPGTARPDWEALVPLVCAEAARDAGDHIRAARAAGAAPLDLANAAALLGLHAYGERLVVGQLPLSAEDRYRHAEMVDRVYETLAYELPRELVHELGNAPRAVRRLQGRR